MTIESTIPENMPQRKAGMSQKFGRFMLRLMGWKLTGELPNEPKLMVILAPHTSNWDFILAVSVLLALNLKVSFMMKKEAFFWPFKNMFMNFGAIPIDRKQATDVVGQAVGWYRDHDQVWLGITPEGTRSKVYSWKTGFLRIAYDADVPVMLVGMNAPEKSIIIDKVVRATGNHELQAEEIRQYMNDKFVGINPQNQ
ncbi:1-acyl-sn-glycerol-3-phosphate acyltransferase [Pseudomaricurvus hydrocarbonicus]|nr:1-acyl-sn-glycerol-3-phosphate acyltransferase [Aestuariicella hydrocarbonica]